ncbi:MAG: biopolymer transporter Tol [Bdellovibrionales bacterium RIFCSPHIGHO2_01_FULL_40_29]|nr:MAG: biopolymer transporter Tol [Bdellovibrionales bacterium RIFCSPHIGHO2_01_FULL_40_29]OFZ32955.1 MAG: biopolymer transporter Tol [Bdellovibrionales bacterium RIFCSPHIGHO2_02_FULL_40_15]
MKKIYSLVIACISFVVILSSLKSTAQVEKNLIPTSIVSTQNTFYTNSKQITFVGPRSGEGYFSQDGQKMIFQSERELGNPFYQMYIVDLQNGQTQRVSTGQGKTTCGWIHPAGKKVMWSSTHLDPKIKDKVKAEYEERAKPVKGRYSWSFDEEFDIFESDLHGQKVKQLTRAKGYDAEGSYSPDGQWIAFASNRSAYTEKLSDEEKKIFDRDPSYAMDIYIMKADGSQVKRLTTSSGYDGGPFFSADGKKITWRRFSADGSKAEIYTMNVDGSNQKQITQLGSMSWAPYFHPSGDYIIFGSSILGYANFELFIVDTEGKQKPVRITFSDGFDGLASFSPDGQKLTWSHRNEKGESQIYLADWNDNEARKALNLPPALKMKETQNPLKLSESINQDDIKAIVKYLADESMEGRATGSAKEIIYTNTIAQLFKDWGLKPAIGKDFIHTFEFISAVEATDKNTLELGGRVSKKLTRSADYQVLSYSKSGKFPAAPVAFAGFGVKVSATEKLPAVDSYKGLDVTGKWVAILDGAPDHVQKEMRLHLLTFSRPQHKITVAKNQGAAGVIFISNSGLKTVRFEGSLSDTTLPVLKISEDVFLELLKKSDQNSQFRTFKALQDHYLQSPEATGFILNSQYVSAEVDLLAKRSTGRNVIAKLEPKRYQKNKALIIGGHGDHLGRGVQTGSSLAKANEIGQIHFGADDNASGVAGVLELAHHFSSVKNREKLKKPLYFAIWSGEEIGVLGSNAFVKDWDKVKSPFSKGFEASFNLDMIGRLRDTLQIQGVGSAKEWHGLSEEVGLITGQSLALTSDPYLPTDAMTFYLAQIPSISFFTGAHAEYHSPRDIPETLNYPGLQKTAHVVRTYLEKVATVSSTAVHYEKVEGNSGQRLEGRGFRIYLGTIPDYSQEGVKGVRISGASKNSPAEKAGLKENDIIIEFDKTKIENLYDYVYTLQAVKPGAVTKIKVSRGGQVLELDIMPVLKE